MEFLRTARGRTARLAILSGAYHPPTRAHLALARAALAWVDEVLFVLPRRFPHKSYDAVGLEERKRMLLAATAGEPRFSAGVTEGGLFIDIAHECRAAYGPGTELWFLCGRDAAERIVNWDYGEPGAFTRMLDEFGLLVADREGAYDPPRELSPRIRRLEVSEPLDGISSSEVRRCIRAGDAWRHLVPAAIAEMVEELYG